MLDLYDPGIPSGATNGIKVSNSGGQRDAEWGEVVVAFLVAGEGGSVADAVLEALCLEHIARFKRPKEYRWVEALPKNAYGKVLKTELRSKG